MRFLWILPFAFFLLGYYGALHFIRLSETTVPHIMGLTLHEGMMKLSSAHIAARIVDEQEDAHVPAGIIVRQFPPASVRVKIRSVVDIVISKRPASVCAPSYYGKQYDHVIEDAARRAFRIREHWLEMGGVAGVARAQYPAPGVELTDNVLHVYFSSGSTPFVLMPDIIGKAYGEVREMLENHGMKVQLVALQDSHFINDKAVIFNQKPCPYTIIDRRKPPMVQLAVNP